MNNFKPAFFKFIYILSAILAGICLFGATAAFYADKSVMKPEFHKYLFEKNDIYSHAQSVINTSMTDYIKNLEKYSPKDYEQHSDLFFVLQKSITPEMMKINLDSIRDGLFEYFKGNRQFLPDVYLDTSAVPANSSLNPAAADSNKLSYALTKIDKINLSLILQYINRNDIADRLSIVKLVFYFLDKLPAVSILIFFLLLVAVLAFSGKASVLTGWTALSFITCGFLELAAGILLTSYSYFIIAGNIYPLTSSIPLQSDVLISYIRDCTNCITKLLIISAVILIILSSILYLSPRLFPALFNRRNNKCGDRHQKLKNIIKYASCSVLSILLISVLISKLYIFKRDFYSNDFPVIISKIKNANTVTQVISAKDTVIYSFLIKLVDKKTNKPVPNVEINVSGESSMQKKDYNQTLTTDDAGEARYSLDKGTFLVSFTALHFPNEYQIPSPFYFDLKTAGTKIITVNLESPPDADLQNMGIVEIEVLDEDNRPVPDLNLSAQGVAEASGSPDNVLSITNSDGIAVFKLNEGNFKISFTESTLLKQYVKPSPITAAITANTVTRYTLRLSGKK